MMRGQRAWRGMGPLQVVAAVSFDKRSLEVPHAWPEGVQALVRACLTANPARRPSAAEILERVQALLRELRPLPEERESQREGVSH
jgi:serine/threonine protein kinase